VAGFWINKLYSPLGWRSWEELVDEWVKANEQYRLGNAAPLKKFKNSSLAETWEEKGRGAEHRELAARAEPYAPGEVPRGGLMLTMGVDVQPDRLEASRVGLRPRRGELARRAPHHLRRPEPRGGHAGVALDALTEIRARR
jgi:phage terminase large subunit GpA-like protein